MDSKFFILCAMQLTVSSMFTIIGPFYPQRAEEEGVSLTAIGFIFSLNPIGQAISSPLTGHYLEFIGRRRGIVWSLAMMTLSVLMLGLVDFCEYTAFIALSVSSRFLCGISTGVFFTIVFAIISSNYTDQLKTAIAYIEISGGLGLVCGPIIGSCLFYIGGYFLPFLFFTIFYAISVPLVYVALGPDREYVIRNESFKKYDLLTNRFIVLDLLNCSLLMFGIGLLSPIILLHLLEYGLSIETSAVLSATITLAYMISAPIVAKFPKSFSFRSTMSAGLFVLALSFYLVGPVQPIPNLLSMIILGMVLQGVSFALTYIPCMPNMIQTCTNDIGFENDDKLADALSGLLTLASALGEILGPIIGGFLVETYNYQVTFGFVSALSLSYFFVYFTFTSKKKRGLLSKSESDAALFELQSSISTKLIDESSIQTS